jgi:hypothetical protein
VKPPAAAPHAHVALAAQRVHRARREHPAGRDGREPQPLSAAAAVPVVRERRELAQQALGGCRLVRPGLLGHVGAQRLDLADRDLVGSTSRPLHDHAFEFPPVLIRNVNWRGSLGSWGS